jgi:hypothetical protein
MAGGLSVQAKWALGIGALAVGAGFFAVQARRNQGVAVPSASAPAADPSPSASTDPRSRRPPTPLPRWPFEDASATPRVVPVQSQDPREDQRLRDLPPEARKAERTRRSVEGRQSRYPAGCRPASSEPVRRLFPHYVAPVVRPLAPAPLELGHALLRATQDREHLLPKGSVVLTLEVAVDGQRVPFEVKDAELLKPGPTEGVRPESLATVEFRDDGAPPDKVAKDGISTARVSLPQRHLNYEGEVRVRADVSTATERGEIVFPLVSTPAPPAALTGTVREAVENGSLAFYAGIRVEKPGRYDFTGRVYDAEQRALAVLNVNLELSPSVHEVRFALCGTLVRDAAVAGPWELRDLEGFRFAENEGRFERTPVPTWSGPHRTRVYPLETFSEGASAKTEPSGP